MKKWFLILLFFITIVSTGCKEKSYIVFNREPITPENVLDVDYSFKTGERVYYLITLPEPVLTRQLYVQVFKRDNDEMRYGYLRLQAYLRKNSKTERRTTVLLHRLLCPERSRTL